MVAAGVLPGVVDVLCSSGEGLEGEVGVDLEAGGSGDGVGEAVDMVAGHTVVCSAGSAGTSGHPQCSWTWPFNGIKASSDQIVQQRVNHRGVFRRPLDDPDPERVGSVMSIHNRSTV